MLAVRLSGGIRVPLGARSLWDNSCCHAQKQAQPMAQISPVLDPLRHDACLYHEINVLDPLR